MRRHIPYSLGRHEAVCFPALRKRLGAVVCNTACPRTMDFESALMLCSMRDLG